MPKEHVGDPVDLITADHPPRSDSPEYRASRKTLMEKYGGGCFICDGPIDLSHPEVEDAKGLQDHHGGGIYVQFGGRPVLVALGTLQLEWSEGWGADAAVVAGMVANTNTLLKQLKEPTYDEPITDTKSVMAYVDSIFNANVKLCAAHHIGHPAQKSLDRRGHEAVGIHNVPLPVLLYQLFCDWEHWDMFAGTTGTLAVAPDSRRPGAAVVLHVDAAHSDRKIVEAGIEGKQVILPPDHPACKAAHRTSKYTTAAHAG
ncbi:MAG: hypothetical protein QOI91_1128 [Solirubrobacteraceae bacterium]|jgi:hypothetical protein|nr:hypothetical protein [Solirubrobacteraceae bacterium]